MAYFQTFYRYVHIDKILSCGSFFKKNGGCLNIFIIYDSFVEFGATFATKFMKRPTIFFTYFETSTLFLQLYKVSSIVNQQNENAACFNMRTKCGLFQQLWTIFWTKIVKNPQNFVTYFSILFHLLHCHAVQWWPHF